MTMPRKLPIHIFVITNDKSMSNNLVQNLEIETDYVVFQNSSAEEFFSDLQSTPLPKQSIPVIIADYELQNSDSPNAMNGIEFLKRIKGGNAHWQVITMSDYSMKKVKNDALQLGAYYHVFKNEYTFARLKAKINEIENDYKLKLKKRRLVLVTVIFVSLLIILSFVSFLLHILE